MNEFDPKRANQLLKAVVMGTPKEEVALTPYEEEYYDWLKQEVEVMEASGIQPDFLQE